MYKGYRQFWQPIDCLYFGREILLYSRFSKVFFVLIGFWIEASKRWLIPFFDKIDILFLNLSLNYIGQINLENLFPVIEIIAYRNQIK